MRRRLHIQPRTSHAFARGFTLLEVLVAMLITAVGLLGIAKMQALSYSSTANASVRSLVALEAAGLASAMHANQAYWAQPHSALPIITITGTTISDNTMNNSTATCAYGSPCSAPDALAAYDLHTWSNNLNAIVPGATTTISCPVPVPLVSAPISCTIAIAWTEKTVASNAQGTTMLAPSYTLYVQP